MGRMRSLAVASTVATFALVAIGGLVRATKSGLGCGTDWPDCSGKVIPVFDDYTVVIEFSHRVAAAAVTVLIATLAFTAIKYHRHQPKILWSAVGAFVLVLFQAGLGAAVVMLELHADTVVLHLAAAMTLLALLIHLTTRIAATDGSRWPTDRPTSRASLAAAVGVLFLLLVGSYLSGTGGTGGFRDWPLMDGRLVPDLDTQAAAIHFFHRAVAAVVGVIVLVVTVKVARRKAEMPSAARLAHVAAGMFVAEVLIGAINVWTGLNPAAVTAHLVLGATIWASLIGMAAVTSPALVEVAEKDASRAPAPRRTALQAGRS